MSAEDLETAELEWLAGALGLTLVAHGEPRSGPMPGSAERSFWVLRGPGGTGVRQLVPMVPGGGRVLEAFNDAMPVAARLRRAATGRVLGPRCGRLLRLQRRTLRADLAARRPGEDPGTILEVLGRAFGHRVEVGIALGTMRRPNRKPVLQVLSPGDRRIVGFAKIGWNDHTNDLVDEEAAALTRMSGLATNAIRVPEVLLHTRWQGRSILLTAPGPSHVLPLSRAGTLASPAAELEVAVSLPDAGAMPLAGSAFLRSLRERAERLVGGSGQPGATARAVLLALDGSEADATDEPMPFGAWHGDWAPWNMSHVGREGPVFVWDWERYGGPVPVGFDRVHMGFQTHWAAGRRSVAGAASAAENGARRVAGDLGIDPSTVPTLVRCYLLEQVLRLEEGRAAGMQVVDSFATEALTFIEGAGVVHRGAGAGSRAAEDGS